MKTLRDKISTIIYTATENYENGADPTCGSVADAIIACFDSHEDILCPGCGGGKTITEHFTKRIIVCPICNARGKV